MNKIADGKKYFSRGVEEKFKGEKRKGGTILTNHNPYALSSVANMNRKKNQNRIWGWRILVLGQPLGFKICRAQRTLS